MPWEDKFADEPQRHRQVHRSSSASRDAEDRASLSGTVKKWQLPWFFPQENDGTCLEMVMSEEGA